VLNIGSRFAIVSALIVIAGEYLQIHLGNDCKYVALKYGYNLNHTLFQIGIVRVYELFGSTKESSYIYSTLLIFVGLFFLYNSFNIMKTILKNVIAKYLYYTLAVGMLLLSYFHLSIVTAYTVLRLQYFVDDRCLVDFASFVLGLTVPLYMTAPRYAMVEMGSILVQLGFGLPHEWVVPISIFTCIMGDILWPISSNTNNINKKVDKKKKVK